jgi:hypothetical protein
MPDDYPWSPGAERSLMLDVGELAARIGAHDFYDRRGQVLWWDHAQGGLAPWIRSGGGTGNAVDILADQSYMGGFAIEMKAGSDGSQVSQISHHFAAPELNRWGAEIAIGFPTEFDYFQLKLRLFDGSAIHIAQVELDNTDEKIRVLTTGGVLVDVDDLYNLVSTVATYHHLKLVADFESDEYVRLLLNSEEYDLSGVALDTDPSVEPPHQRLSLHHFGRAATNDRALVGNAILTVGEP